jgi:hypothetical protein
MKMETRIGLGDLVKDRITGFEGIVTALTFYQYGCVRALVQPQGMGKDGKPIEPQVFDDPQLKIIRVGAIVPDEKEPEKKKKEGPHGWRDDKLALRRP